jgi:hypothetical protein
MPGGLAMTPEEALKHIALLVETVDETTPPRALWLTIRNVQELVRKVEAEKRKVPSGGPVVAPGWSSLGEQKR